MKLARRIRDRLAGRSAEPSAPHELPPASRPPASCSVPDSAAAARSLGALPTAGAGGCSLGAMPTTGAGCCSGGALPTTGTGSCSSGAAPTTGAGCCSGGALPTTGAGSCSGGAAPTLAPQAPASPGRRSLTAGLAALAAAAVALLAVPRSVARAAAESVTGAAPRRRRRWGMAIDLDLCTACGACTVACKTENNVPAMGPGEENDGARLEWMTLLHAVEGESPFGLSDETLPIPCLHCDDPPCTKVCPVNATYQTDEGITAQVWDRCIGCRYCMVACPYARRYFNWTEPAWPEGFRSYLNPDVATRPKGVVEKCTFCHHRIRRVTEDARMQGEEVTDETLQSLPACAEACPADAIVFGDLSDEQSRVSKLSHSPRSFRLLEELGTRPKVFYLRRDRREDVS